MTMLIGAFPDLRFTTELMVADNDLVSAFTKVSGTHQGEFMGIPATGRSFLVNNAVDRRSRRLTSGQSGVSDLLEVTAGRGRGACGSRTMPAR
jgi:predicted ester cyclase